MRFEDRFQNCKDYEIRQGMTDLADEVGEECFHYVCGVVWASQRLPANQGLVLLRECYDQQGLAAALPATRFGFADPKPTAAR